MNKFNKFTLRLNDYDYKMLQEMSTFKGINMAFFIRKLIQEEYKRQVEKIDICSRCNNGNRKD